MTAESEHFLSSLLTANDATQAMQAAVSHVSDSLRCDISWTGLAEQDDQLHMGVHHGLRTPEMSATWRLAIGDGVGGRAALLARTQKSSNYLHDSRRVPAKRLIDNEKIATVLVTPLSASGSPVGVLYAAHRQLRAWTPDDVDQLESVSHYLSIRLEQLRQDAQTKSTVRSFKRRAVAADSALRSSSKLIESLTNTEEIGSTLDVAAVALNARIELHDDQGLTLHAAGPDEASCRGPRLSSTLGRRSRLSIRLLGVDDQPSPADTPVWLALNTLRLQLLRLSERAATREKLRGELLDNLLTGKFTDAGHARRQLSLIGHPRLAESAQVVIIKPRTAPDRLSSRFHADLRTTFPQSLIDHRDSAVVIIIAAIRSEERLIQQMTDLLNREEGRRRNAEVETNGQARRSFIAGIGRRSGQLHEISISYDEAKVACSIGCLDLHTGGNGVASARTLGLQGLANMPHSQLKTTVHDTFGPVLDHDERRGTEYMRTVRSYLFHDRHLGKTASELHLHYNTVRNRISRIEDLLNLRFDHADDRYRAETAIRMVSVLTALTDPPSLTVRS